MQNNKTISLWIKVPYTLMVCIIVPIYWNAYGPTNFLWFCDVALLLMVPALWLENPLLASMMCIGVLPLEIMWMIAFLSGGAFFHMADYMFDPKLPLYLRGLSLFHFPMPAIIIFVLIRFGYDKRALLAQALLTSTIIIATYALSKPEDNINWVFAIDKIQTTIPPFIYLALQIAILVALVFTPTHFFLKKLFPLQVKPAARTM